MNGDDIDPQVRTFVKRVNAAYSDLLGDSEADFPTRRAVAEKVREPWRTGGPSMVSSEDLRVGPSRVRIRIHRPNEEAVLPALVYIHGGGWTTFSLDTHDRLMREYAARAGCAVVGVDYSLSPEARYPVALGEVSEVLDWLDREGAKAGIDAARLAVAGDSAGANLSIASMICARDAGAPLVRGMLLNYGAYDEEPRDSHERFGSEAYMLNPQEMDAFWRNYRGEDRSPDPQARPLLADLSGLPPAFLCIAECDILADENREMARRLEAAGVDVDVEVYRGATHSFLEAVSISSLADRALADGSAWLRQVLAG